MRRIAFTAVPEELPLLTVTVTLATMLPRRRISFRSDDRFFRDSRIRTTCRLPAATPLRVMPWNFMTWAWRRLIVILARMGSYVPARAARIGPIDRVFTRIGASDDLAGGRSTFMLEMTEAANILNNATAQSLVLMDEIGRGTSTYDGLSLAWACAQHLARNTRAFTLFATHYFELTSLAAELEGCTNVHLDATEHGDKLIFLHTVKEGPANQSYGLQVAALAWGCPPGTVTLNACSARPSTT